MHRAHLTESVRRRVVTTFADMGLAGAGELRESILIRCGAYCGRRFDVERGHAVWFAEEDQVKFYDASGRLAAVMATGEGGQSPLRMAA